MKSTESPPDWASVEVVVPRQPGRLPGVGMAGFRQRAPARAAHPKGARGGCAGRVTPGAVVRGVRRGGGPGRT
ncbi:hypothetical protein SSTG_03042 [Streptomyces sp. e14]|nr:hypothetical protein SSTG_03042 [Streptomyces sp. e14]